MERVPNDRSMDSIGLVLRPRDALWCSFSGRDAAGSGGARARAQASRRARSGGKIGTGRTRRTRSFRARRHARVTSAARLRPRGSVRRNTPVSPKPTSSSPVVATPRARGNAWVLSPAYLRQAPRSCFGGLRVTRRDEGSVRGCRVRSEWRAAAAVDRQNVRSGFLPKRGVTQSQKTHSRKFSSHEPRAIFAETRLRAPVCFPVSRSKGIACSTFLQHPRSYAFSVTSRSQRR